MATDLAKFLADRAQEEDLNTTPPSSEPSSEKRSYIDSEQDRLEKAMQDELMVAEEKEKFNEV